MNYGIEIPPKSFIFDHPWIMDPLNQPPPPEIARVPAKVMAY